MDIKQNISEVKTDIRLLLDCLKYQVDNPAALNQAFRTLAAIFSNVAGDDVKEYFRSLGGLDFITSIIKTVSNVEVKETALFCLGCAIENNVYSQKELTTSSQFQTLHKILSDDKSTAKLKHAASYLLLTLVSNNSIGQTLAKKTLCLSDLIGLLRTSLPSTGIKDCWFEDAGTTGLELWSSIATTLCMCVNNPQNEKNQEVCGFILPYVFTVLQQTEDEKIIKPLLSVVRFTVANNDSNQTQVKRCGGLEVLSEKLSKAVKKGIEATAIPIISTIDACIADHVENAEEIGRLETVKTMIQLLNSENVDHEQKLQIVVSLVHAVEMADRNKEQLMEESGLLALMKSLSDIESGDDELFKAVKYLSQLCAKQVEDCDPASESSVMLEILRKTEAMHRNSGLLLLHKINELSDRLQTFEEDSARGFQQLASPASHLSEHSNLRQRLQQEYLTSKSVPEHFNVENDRPFSVGEKFGNMTGIPHQNPLHISSGLNHNSKCFQKRSEEFALRNFDSFMPYECIPMAATPSKQYTRQHENENRVHELQIPSKSHFFNKNFETNGDGIYFNRNNCTPRKDLNNNFSGCKLPPEPYDEKSLIKAAYRNEVELNRLYPSVSDLNIAPNDFMHYLNSEDFNRSMCNRSFTDMTGTCENDKLNINIKNVLNANGNYSVNEKGDFSFSGQNSSNISKTWTRETEVFDYDHQRHIVGRFSSDIGNVDHANCNEQLHCGHSYEEGPSKISDMPGLNRSRKYNNDERHTGGEKSEHLADCNNNTKSLPDRNDNIEKIVNQPSFKQSQLLNSENDCMFLNGHDANEKSSIKPKKYEVRLVECEVAENDCMTENRNISKLSVKAQDFENKIVIGNNCGASAKPNEILRQNDYLVEDQNTCLGNMEAKNPGKPQKACDQLDKNILNERQDNKASLGSERECAVQRGYNSDDKFVKPIGRPLTRKIKTSVRRAQPFWKSQLKSDSDTDYSSSCDEDSVFDHQLITNAKQNFPSCPRSSLAPCNTPGSTPNRSNVMRPSSSTRPNSCSSSVYFSSPGSAYSNTSVSSLESYDDTTHRNSCPGCTGTMADLKLNSRTYNIAMETNPYTCNYHRNIRDIERQYIKSLPNKSKKMKISSLPCDPSGEDVHGMSVYEMSSDSDSGITPPEKQATFLEMKKTPTPRRRKRVPFSEEETKNLLLGVEKFGKSWSLILQMFEFHNSRTAVDLKDKFRGIQKKSNQKRFKQVQRGKPFSMCEDRRLLRGVTRHGYNWKIILETMTFCKERTSEDLRNRWRTLHKKQSSK